MPHFGIVGIGRPGTFAVESKRVTDSRLVGIALYAHLLSPLSRFPSPPLPKRSKWFSGLRLTVDCIRGAILDYTRPMPVALNCTSWTVRDIVHTTNVPTASMPFWCRGCNNCALLRRRNQRRCSPSGPATSPTEPKPAALRPCRRWTADPRPGRFGAIHGNKPSVYHTRTLQYDSLPTGKNSVVISAAELPPEFETATLQEQIIITL